MFYLVLCLLKGKGEEIGGGEKGNGGGEKKRVESDISPIIQKIKNEAGQEGELPLVFIRN